jgi:hypothetical protein
MQPVVNECSVWGKSKARLFAHTVVVAGSFTTG